ncbi:hypothetical protein [Trichothermofontia sp.]
MIKPENGEAKSGDPSEECHDPATIALNSPALYRRDPDAFTHQNRP